MSIVVRVRIVTPTFDVTKAMKLGAELTVGEVIAELTERNSLSPTEVEDYVLTSPDNKIFNPADKFQSYAPQLLEYLHFKPKPRYITAIGLDGTSRMKVLVDFLFPAQEAMVAIINQYGYDLTGLGLKLPSTGGTTSQPDDPKKTLLLRAEKTGKDLEPHMALANNGVSPDDVLALVPPKKKSKVPELLSKLSHSRSRRKSLSAVQVSSINTSKDGGGMMGLVPSAKEGEKLSTAEKRRSLRRGYSSNKQPVFGLSLAIPYPVRTEPGAKKKKSYIPPPVLRMFDYIDRVGSHVEGIFRLSASKPVVQDYKLAVEQDNRFNFDCVTDPNIVADLLKIYLRSIPDPLIPTPLYKRIVALDPADFGTKMKEILAEMPKPNTQVVKQLLRTLAIVNKNTSETKMTEKSLAICFGPIFKPSEELPTTPTIDVSVAIEFKAALAYMIQHVEDLFVKVKKRTRSSMTKSLSLSASGSASALSHTSSVETPRRSISVSSADGDALAEQDEPMRRSGILHMAALVTKKYDDKDILFYAKADYDFVPELQFEVPLKEGELVAVFLEEDGWWLAKVLDPTQTLKGSAPVGLVPSTYCTKTELDKTRSPRGSGSSEVYSAEASPQSSPPASPTGVPSPNPEKSTDSAVGPSQLAELSALVADRDKEIVELQQQLLTLKTQLAAIPAPSISKPSVAKPTSPQAAAATPWATILAVWILSIAIVFALARFA